MAKMEAQHYMLTSTITSATYTRGAADDAGTGGVSWFCGTVVGSCCIGAGGDAGTPDTQTCCLLRRLSAGIVNEGLRLTGCNNDERPGCRCSGCRASINQRSNHRATACELDAAKQLAGSTG
jgi:hypothetical protein